MADFITQFPANEIVARSNFNTRIAEANAGLIAVQNAAAAAQSTADQKANASHNHSASNITSGTLALARGGTGQTTAAGIRNTLGLGNTTDALPVANGGTGAVSATAARTALGVLSADEINTALSNKANGYVRSLYAGDDLDEATLGGSYAASAAVAGSIINSPTSAAFALYVFTADFRVLQVVTRTNPLAAGTGNVLWYRVLSVADGTKGPWRELATATPPTWYNLPLASGITEHTTPQYCKTQGGIIYCDGYVVGAAKDAVVATLPAGYRPKRMVRVIVAQNTGTGSNDTARLEIATNGQITPFSTSAASLLQYGLSLCFSFVSADA